VWIVDCNETKLHGRFRWNFVFSFQKNRKDPTWNCQKSSGDSEQFKSILMGKGAKGKNSLCPFRLLSLYEAKFCVEHRFDYSKSINNNHSNIRQNCLKDSTQMWMNDLCFVIGNDCLIFGCFHIVHETQNVIQQKKLNWLSLVYCNRGIQLTSFLLVLYQIECPF
jgi:hypothetical protein